MLFNPWALLSLVLALIKVASADTVTVTNTRHVSPDWFKSYMSYLLPGNPASQDTGIEIVFVYQDTAPQPTVASDIIYTVSTQSTQLLTSSYYDGSAWQEVVHTNIVPQSYTTRAVLANNAAQTTISGTGKARSTIYEIETAIDIDEEQATITRSAPTTTKTIFHATEVPVTIFQASTAVESITKIQSNPLNSQPVVSKSLTKSISTSFSSAVTFPNMVAGQDSQSSGTTSKSAPSTLDLRISSESTASPQATPAKDGGQYTNGTVIISHLQLSTSSTNSSSSSVVTSGALLNSSSAAVATPTALNTSSIASSSPTGSKVTGDESNSGNLFETISSSSPLSVFGRDELPLSIPNGVDNNGAPISTNKFHANLFLGDQTDTVWPAPYGLFWKKQDYYGFGVTHANASNYVYVSGNSNNPNVPSTYLNPVGNAEFIFSATDFTKTNNYLGVTDIKEMSILVTVTSQSDETKNTLQIPIVQGMGFVTGIYNGNLIPVLNSLIGVLDLTQETSGVLDSKTLKYRATLFSGGQWLIYVTLPSSSTSFELLVADPYHLRGSTSVDGLIIQLAYAPSDSKSEGFYDEAAGQYVTDALVTGSVSGGTAANYNFEYTTKGSSSNGKPIVFALPHHVESLTSSTAQTNTGITLDSNTKGKMQAYLTDKLELQETLQTAIQYLPWAQTQSSALSYTNDQLNLLVQVANEELAVDIAGTVALMDSTYYSGKVLDKYAYILLVVSEIIEDEDVARSTLEEIKTAFDQFLKNKQHFPFMYDTKFGGITSTSAQGGDTGADFGSAYYNDHHFHYGYYVHAAAIVGYVDKKLGGTWAEDNKDWVNSLIRDVANPSTSDPYFPVSRMFDWYGGHSWAAGLFASGDGKNEESSSEDYNFSYGMRLWGKLIGDDSMKSRGDLMLAILSRAMNKYFYYKKDNTVEPSKYIPNKVSGIFFENKVTYTTFFGGPDHNPEYVHGIHMLPITPASSLIRIPSYVQEEWNDQISTFIDNVNSGWTGILRLNQALYDAKSSYDFFSSSDWQSSYLDNGQSRTWSLAFSGGLANST